MRCLLDTHTFIWFTEGNTQLPEKIRSVIASGNQAIYVSIVSFWEIALKQNSGKLKLSRTLSDIFTYAQENYFEILPIASEALCQLSTLELHHKDPFDRLLIATALADNLTLISADQHFQAYAGLQLLWD
jgi:PIN domain nuclease of toxin-antitoxin system